MVVPDALAALLAVVVVVAAASMALVVVPVAMLGATRMVRSLVIVMIPV